jgi:hypothetical protein
VVEFSDVVMLEIEFSDAVVLEDARTSEAMRLASDASSVGLYRRFQYNERKVSARSQSYVP